MYRTICTIHRYDRIHTIHTYVSDDLCALTIHPYDTKILARDIPPLRDKTVRAWLPKADKHCLMAGQVPTIYIYIYIYIYITKEKL